MRIIKIASLAILTSISHQVMAQSVDMPVMTSPQVKPQQFETFFFGFKQGRGILYIDYVQNTANANTFVGLIRQNQAQISSGEYLIAVRSYSKDKSIARGRALEIKSYFIRRVGVVESNFSTLITTSPMDSASEGVTVGMVPSSGKDGTLITK